MNLQPSDLLYAVAQPFALKGALYQSLTVGLGFDLLSGQVQPAAQVIGAAMQSLAPGDCLDMGLPKPTAEWLLAGSALTPEGKPMPSLLATVRVGASSRRFLLVGEANQAFCAAPLTWAETFGAPDNPENPLGCGLQPDPKTGRVSPPRLTGADDAHGRPACPGPMGAWPARMRGMGTYDRNWLKIRCPDLPDDCDLSYANLAQPAQRLPSGLAGSEAVSLSGLNAAHPAIETRLPGKTLTVFVTRKGEQEKSLVVAYDTLWLFPNALSGLLLGHVLLPCADGIASDIELVRLEMTPPDPVAVPEPAAAPPPPPLPPPPAPPETAAAAEAVGLSSQAGKIAAAAAIAAGVAAVGASGKASAAPAASAAAPQTPPSAAEAVNAMREKALKELKTSLPEINAGLAEAGLPPLSPEQIAETQAQIVAQTGKMQELMQQIEAAPDPDLHSVLQQAGVSPEMIKGVDAVLDMPPPNPADYSDAASWHAAVDRHLAAFETHLPLSDEVRESQRTLLRLQGPGGDALLEKMAGPTPTLGEALVKAGLAPDKASLLSGELGRVPDFQSTEEMKAYMRRLETLMDFAPGAMTSVVEDVEKMAAQTGVTLSLPATTAASSAAASPTSNVDAARLAGRSASAANSAQTAKSGDAAAKAMGGLAAGAALSVAAGAALNAAPKAGISQDAAAPEPPAVPPAPEPPPAAEAAPSLDYAYQELTGRDFSGMKLDGANFTHSQLADANFSGASLKNADFDDADCPRANFTHAVLDGASLQRTNFHQATLSDASAQKARFLQSDLREAKASGLNARDAELDGANLAGGGFARASFAGALLKNIDATGCSASAADFSDANCQNSDFTAATLTDVKLQHAVFAGAVFDRADLTKANLSGLTLMRGSRASQANAANFSGANLANVDWREVAAVKARFNGAVGQGGRFAACQLGGSQWPLADLRGADFSHSTLTGASFENANLMRAALRESHVEGASFDRANLYGADVYRASMTLASLDGAIIDNTLIAARKEAS
ncbi:MAG: pentapeptide repeat-containing protein [Candidatus Accumulibacter sp.]|jgi:uncharacterized protein YjbI with pentapeptide repeats|nr:pentapeptide repeat-containing protein [Accumulibacter sp.]